MEKFNCKFLQALFFELMAKRGRKHQVNALNLCLQQDQQGESNDSLLIFELKNNLSKTIT